MGELNPILDGAGDEAPIHARVVDRGDRVRLSLRQGFRDASYALSPAAARELARSLWDRAGACRRTCELVTGRVAPGDRVLVARLDCPAPGLTWPAELSPGRLDGPFTVAETDVSRWLAGERQRLSRRVRLAEDPWSGHRFVLQQGYDHYLWTPAFEEAASPDTPETRCYLVRETGQGGP